MSLARQPSDQRTAIRRHGKEATTYFTDRGIEELEDRRGEELATFAAGAGHMRRFVDLSPEHEIPVGWLATWLARLDGDGD